MKLGEQQIAEGMLFTDQYQLSMAQVYFRNGLHEHKVQFDHFFRTYPNYGTHQSGFAVNAGLEWLVDWMQRTRFRPEDINYLRNHKDRNGKSIFADDFLKWLENYGNFESLTLRAIPEGRIVHANVPLTVVEGSLAMAQILETALLNQLNYQILIATKAARLRTVAQGGTILEFGLRRGQSTGANAGARAALIGGANFSSNVGMSHLLGYPPKGTHAHSLVQLYNALGLGELEAFRAYAEIYPDECILLVDTVNTLESGIPNALKVFEELRRKGHKPLGVRLDSGDLAYLSIQAAKMLDSAGFPDVSIVLSNELDELVIWQIQTQILTEAKRYGVDPEQLLKRLVYGVGTNLIVSHGDPALGGVYKLVAVEKNTRWLPALKISETPAKTPNPGNKLVWRIYDERGKATADLLTLSDEDPRQMNDILCRHPSDPSKFRLLEQNNISKIEPLLVDIIKDGKVIYNFPTIEALRQQREADAENLDEGVKRIINPHNYHVSLTEKLWELKQNLIIQALHKKSS
jgi:nicotinate phosphoribosyltransferase